MSKNPPLFDQQVGKFGRTFENLPHCSKVRIFLKMVTMVSLFPGFFGIDSCDCRVRLLKQANRSQQKWNGDDPDLRGSRGNFDWFKRYVQVLS